MLNSALISNLSHNLTPVSGVACQSVTIAATAGTLESLGGFTFSPQMRYVQVAIETAAVRTDPSGTAPTSSVGQPIASGTIVLLSRAEATTGQWIRSTGTSATAQVSQYR